MALGARVRYYRKKLGLTLEALADASLVDIGTLSALENRDSERSRYVAQIARAFGLTMEQLLDESRDWLAPAAPTPAAQRVSSGEPTQYAVSTWLFSAELLEALRRRPRSELDRIENIVRAHLGMPLLAPAANSAAA